MIPQNEDIFVRTMLGLGDDFYIRAALVPVSRRSRIYVISSRPLVHADYARRAFVQKGRRLYNYIEKSAIESSEEFNEISLVPPGSTLSLAYRDPKYGSIEDQFRRITGEYLKFSSPDIQYPETIFPPKSYILVKYPALRTLLSGSSEHVSLCRKAILMRSPPEGVIPRLVKVLKKRFPDKKIISLSCPEESLIDEEVCDVRVRSYLPLRGLLSLIKNSFLCLSGNCFCIPLTASFEVPCFVVFGSHAGPEFTICQDMRQIGWVESDDAVYVDRWLQGLTNRPESCSKAEQALEEFLSRADLR